MRQRVQTRHTCRKTYLWQSYYYILRNGLKASPPRAPEIGPGVRVRKEGVRTCRYSERFASLFAVDQFFIGVNIASSRRSTESMAREVNRDDAWSQPGSLTIASALSVFNIAGGEGAPGNSLDAQR